MNTFLFFGLPFLTGLGVQLLLCFLVKRKLLRHLTLALVLVFLVIALAALINGDGSFLVGANGLLAMLWLLAGLCCLWGYGMAWGVYALVRMVRYFIQTQLDGEKEKTDRTV
ncbi:MAG: hypothetical protein IJU29_01505 [Oscillospiraceae bacterium]|nr:hypothetical protein [Oscillospiraceae bacterium]